MTFIKLRLTTQFDNLADQVGCLKTTVHDNFRRWINPMYVKLEFLIKRLDCDASMQTQPNVFRQYFPKLTAIHDRTEVFIDRLKTYKARVQVYSNYQNHSTVKFLTAFTPLDSISFTSKAWGGRVTDPDIVKDFDLISLNLSIHGDQLLAVLQMEKNS